MQSLPFFQHMGRITGKLRGAPHGTPVPRNSALLPYLRRFSMRLRDALELAQQSLWLALLGALAVLVAGRIWPLENLVRWAALPAAAWLAALFGYTIFRPISPLRAARRVDEELHLKERLSSSLALAGLSEHSPSANTPRGFRPELVAKLHADALQTAQQIRPGLDFPLRFYRRPLLYAGIALSIALALVWLPNPMDDILRERQSAAREAQRQAEQVEKLRAEIANNKEMSPEEREELLRKLEELARQLRDNPGDRKQALADLSRMENSLQEKIDPRAGQRQAMLEALAAQMQALAAQSQAPEQDNSARGDLEEAAKALEQLAEQMESMSQEEREALAQQLGQMATRAAQAGDSALAQSLASMSQAAQSGDMQQAAQSAQQASENLQGAASETANQRAFSQSLSQVQSSRQSMASSGQQRAQSGQPGQNGQGQNGQSKQGQNGQNGQGQNGQNQNGNSQGQSGQSSSQGKQAGGGGGTKANTLPGATRSGQAGSPQGQAGSGDVDELDHQVYAPRETSGQGQDELSISAQDTGQGDITSTEQRDPTAGGNNPALVPYQSVFQSYLDAATGAMDQSYIPPGMKDYVKNYFSQLEP